MLNVLHHLNHVYIMSMRLLNSTLPHWGKLLRKSFSVCQHINTQYLMSPLICNLCLSSYQSCQQSLWKWLHIYCKYYNTVLGLFGPLEICAWQMLEIVVFFGKERQNWGWCIDLVTLLFHRNLALIHSFAFDLPWVLFCFVHTPATCKAMCLSFHPSTSHSITGQVSDLFTFSLITSSLKVILTYPKSNIALVQAWVSWELSQSASQVKWSDWLTFLMISFRPKWFQIINRSEFMLRQSMKTFPI